MITIINNYINSLDNNFENLQQLDILFEKLCDKYSSNEINNINNIKFILFDRFEYNPMSRTEHIKKICEERDGQNKFREQIILRDKKCLITGDNCEICEAAHIIPYCESKSFEISNGLLLNRCFHKMFDKYMWSINSLGNLEFSNDILNDDYYDNYLIYNGIKLNFDNNCKKYLEIHYKKFLELNSN